MDDLELEMEEVEEADERQNRTFILLVAVMGGLLLIGIAVFCVWAVFFAGRALGGEVSVPPTDTPATVTAAGEAIATEEATDTPVPPAPSPTPRPPASPTPRRTPTPAAIAEVTPTHTATRTPTAGDTPAQTGFGAFTAVVLAAGLLVLLIMARRLRTAH